MAKEKRLIEANALAEHIKDLPTWWADDGGYYPGSMKYPDGMFCPDDIISSIDNAPTVDAVEVVHGEWGYIYTCHGERLWGYKCSRCEQDSAKKSNYCPNCGAKMYGGNEDG